MDGHCGLAAADDRERIGVRYRMRDGQGAACVGVDLEHAHRTVPEDRLGVLQGLGKKLHRCGTDIESVPAYWNFLNGDDLRYRAPLAARRHDAVDRQIEFHSA